jgi:transposase
MLTIGIDPHKHTHSGVAVDPVGVQIAQRSVAARREGFGQLLEWARKLDSERVWVLKDVRHVSGSLERFLIDRGETVVRLPPRLMANARRGVRERGKSDPIDALAIARAALREGIDTLPTARLAGAELEIRLLGLHRERLVETRTRLINELRWQLHDLWPGLGDPQARTDPPGLADQNRRPPASCTPRATETSTPSHSPRTPTRSLAALPQVRQRMATRPLRACRRGSMPRLPSHVTGGAPR